MSPSARYYNNNVDALVHTGPCELIGVIVTDTDAASLAIHNCTSSPAAGNKVLEVQVPAGILTVSIMLPVPIVLHAGLYVDVGTAIAGGSYTIIYR
jgi:hypothetical protein